MSEETTEVKVREPARFSLWDKLRYCYCILRYGNSHMRFMRMLSCERCGSNMIMALEGAERHSEYKGAKIFQNSYVCCNCGAIGTDDQCWWENKAIAEMNKK